MSQESLNKLKLHLNTLNLGDLIDFLVLHWAHLDLPSDQLDQNATTQACSIIYKRLLDTLVKAYHNHHGIESSIRGGVCINGNYASEDYAHHGSRGKVP